MQSNHESLSTASCGGNLHSYWTDDGACYYDFIDSFYEKTLVAVKEQADKDGIPYRYVQVIFSSYYFD